MKLVIAAVVALGLSAPVNSFEKKLKEAKCTLSEAVEKAGKDLKDVTPVSARLKQIKGAYFWDVRMAKGEASLQLKLDARTVELVERKELKGNRVAALAATKVKFARAIEIALKKVPGKAVGVDLEFKKGKAVQEVKIFADGKVFEVKVDAVSGDVLKVEQDDDEDGDDDDVEDEDEDDDD